jgi:hypothetical protein
MKRLIAVLALALLAVGFYVVWPLYGAATIRTALETKDRDLLVSKIDFDAVRDSMRPAVTGKVEEIMTSAGGGGGLAGTFLDQLKKQLAPRIVDATLNDLVKPESLIRLYADGRRLRDSLKELAAESLRKEGPAGMGGSSGGAGDTGRKGARYGLENIKSFGFDGPLSIRLGLARDAEAADPDLTVVMSFRGGEWILTGLEPRF